LEAAGRLLRFEPKSRKPLKRSLFLTVGAVTALNDANSALNLLGVKRGQVFAHFERWVRGERMYASNGKGTSIKRLSGGVEVWTLRITEPVVQVRLFCRFARPYTLVGTHLHTRPMLGRKGSKAWKRAIKDCQDTWESLFPSHPPFSGNSPHAYITENCDDFDF
jgi:hypothetical protein